MGSIGSKTSAARWERSFPVSRSKTRENAALKEGDVVTMGKTDLRIVTETSGAAVSDHSTTLGQQPQIDRPTAQSTVEVIDPKRQKRALEPSESETPPDPDDHPDRNAIVAASLGARDLDFASVGVATANAGEDARKLLYESP